MHMNFNPLFVYLIYFISIYNSIYTYIYIYRSKLIQTTIILFSSQEDVQIILTIVVQSRFQILMLVELVADVALVAVVAVAVVPVVLAAALEVAVLAAALEVAVPVVVVVVVAVLKMHPLVLPQVVLLVAVHQ